MILLHLFIYIIMITLGYCMGILFPYIPWLTLWSFSIAGVITWRLLKRREQARLLHVLQTAEAAADAKAEEVLNKLTAI